MTESRMRPRVAVAHRDLPGAAVARLHDLFEVDTWPFSDAPNSAELAEFGAGAEALIAMGSLAIGEPLLTQCPRLRTVSLVSVGYDRVDVTACRAHRVLVTNTPGVLAKTTADTAMGLMIGARRLFTESVTMLRTGAWKPLGLHEMLSLDVHGATLGPRFAV